MVFFLLLSSVFFLIDLMSFFVFLTYKLTSLFFIKLSSFVDVSLDSAKSFCAISIDVDVSLQQSYKIN